MPDPNIQRISPFFIGSQHGWCIVCAWADFEGPRMGPRIGRRGCFLVQLALYFEPGPFSGLPGPAVGPKGPKIGSKPGAGFVILSSLRSAQVLGTMPAGDATSHTREPGRRPSGGRRAGH